MARQQNNQFKIDLDIIRGDQIDALKDFSSAAKSLTEQLSALTGVGFGGGSVSSRVGTGRAQRSFTGGTGGFAGGIFSTGIGQESSGGRPNPHGVGHQDPLSAEARRRQAQEALHGTLGPVARHNYSGVGQNMSLLDSMHMASGGLVGNAKLASGLLGSYGTKMVPDGEGGYALRSGPLASASRVAGGSLGLIAKSSVAAGLIGGIAEHEAFGSYAQNSQYGQLGYSMNLGSSPFAISAARTQVIEGGLRAYTQGAFRPNWSVEQERSLQSSLIQSGINPNDNQGQRYANLLRGIGKTGVDVSMAQSMLLGTERTGTPEQVQSLADIIKNLGETAKSTGVSVSELQKNLDATAATINQRTGVGQATSLQGAARMQSLLGINAGQQSALTSNLMSNPAIAFGAMQRSGGAAGLASNPQNLVSSMLPLLAQTLGASSTSDLSQNWSRYSQQYEQMNFDTGGQFAQMFGGGMDAQTLGKLMQQFPKRNAADQLDRRDLALAAQGKLTSAQGKTDAMSIASTFMSKSDYSKWKNANKNESGLQMLRNAEKPGAGSKPEIDINFTGDAAKFFKGTIKNASKLGSLVSRVTNDVPNIISNPMGF